MEKATGKDGLGVALGICSTLDPHDQTPCRYSLFGTQPYLLTVLLQQLHSAPSAASADALKWSLGSQSSLNTLSPIGENASFTIIHGESLFSANVRVLCQLILSCFSLKSGEPCSF